MKVSIIIPCYNFEKYIDQSILSALAQKTNFEVEILVGDDNSKDLSKNNIVRYNNSIRFINHNQNLGASRNIKSLIDNSRGEYIAYMDGDDYWTNIYKLQNQIEFMDNNPEYVMTFTGFWQKKDKEYIPPSENNWLCIPGKYKDGELTIDDLVYANTSTFGRVFRNIPGLIKDWMLDTKIFDWVTNYELSKYGKIKYLDFPGGVYRIHDEGVMSSLLREDIFTETESIRKVLKSDYENWLISKLNQ